MNRKILLTVERIDTKSLFAAKDAVLRFEPRIDFEN